MQETGFGADSVSWLLSPEFCAVLNFELGKDVVEKGIRKNEPNLSQVITPRHESTVSNRR
jgi:hypothetical protein